MKKKRVLIMKEEGLFKAKYNNYYKCKFKNKQPLHIAIEIDERSYVNLYNNSNAYKRGIMVLHAVDGKSIAIFHSSPNGLTKYSRKYLKQIKNCDIIVTCYSLFLDDELREKCPIVTPLPIKFELRSCGGKFLYVRSESEGYIKEQLVHDVEEITYEDLIKRSKELKMRSISN